MTEYIENAARHREGEKKKKKSNKFKKFLLDIRKKISSNPVQELDADGTCAMSVSRHSLLDTI